MLKCPHCDRPRWRFNDFCDHCKRPVGVTRVVDGREYIVDSMVDLRYMDRMDPIGARYWRRTGVVREFAGRPVDDPGTTLWFREMADGTHRCTRDRRSFAYTGLAEAAGRFKEWVRLGIMRATSGGP